MENARDSAASVSVEAVVDRVTYSNEENGWSVVRLISIEGDLVTATGPLLGVREGDRLRLSGKWVTHSKFGQQLEVADFLEILPSTVDGIRLFLASGRIKGIGPRNAQRLGELLLCVGQMAGGQVQLQRGTARPADRKIQAT